jgi:hypothetical protein
MIRQPFGMGRSLASLVRGKGFAGGLSVLTIGAVLSPIVQNWREEPRDGFPLSYYPMFSAKRSKTASVTYLVGLYAQGGRRLLPYVYAGTGGLNQVRRQINRAVREGRADKLGQIVAGKVALVGEEPFAAVVTVQVVTGKYRLADYFADKRDPISEFVHASCPVERGS